MGWRSRILKTLSKNAIPIATAAATGNPGLAVTAVVQSLGEDSDQISKDQVTVITEAIDDHQQDIQELRRRIAQLERQARK